MPTTAYIYAATVTRVVDADTLDLTADLGFSIRVSMRVRLLAVNAPETRTEAGRLATSYVRSWLETHGHDVQMHTRKPRDHDKYGRYLARIIAADGACLNDELLQAGHAVEYPT